MLITFIINFIIDYHHHHHHLSSTELSSSISPIHTYNSSVVLIKRKSLGLECSCWSMSSSLWVPPITRWKRWRRDFYMQVMMIHQSMIHGYYIGIQSLTTLVDMVACMIEWYSFIMIILSIITIVIMAILLLIIAIIFINIIIITISFDWPWRSNYNKRGWHREYKASILHPPSPTIEVFD